MHEVAGAMRGQVELLRRIGCAERMLLEVRAEPHGQLYLGTATSSFSWMVREQRFPEVSVAPAVTGTDATTL